mgnify:CR=1 FL=1
MSLFKQISLIMSLFLLFVLIVVVSFNFQSAKQYAQEEMSDNAQNTAAYLSLSLANAEGDISQMSTMINAIYDSGYFQEISLLGTDQKLLYRRIKESEALSVPSWFLSLYNFKTPIASATVSSGWKPIGTVRVTPVEEDAHAKLYKNFLEILQSFAVIALVSFSLLYFLLRFALSSLATVKEQAEAVSDNNFIINKNIPSTSEFKEVTLAMNKMVEKVKDIFAREAASVQDYHKLLYTDGLTGISNRSFFELKLNDFLSSQEADANGTLLTLYLDGVMEANKSIGHDRVNELIQNLSKTAQETAKRKEHSITSRIDGTKICMLFPRMGQEEIEEISDKILALSLMSLEKTALLGNECAVKLLQLSYTPQDSVSTILNQIENALLEAEKNTITKLSSEHSHEEVLEKETIENRIKEHSIALALQDVQDIHSDILHSEAYVRLFDTHRNIHEAGDFIPQVHKLNLDTKLDQNVINYALKESSLEDREIAINISLRFIKDQKSVKWLQERLAGISVERVLSFEISNHSLLSILSEALEFSNMLRKAGHHFGIDRFSIEEGTNLNYLQMLKPQYLKIDSNYLHHMLQGKQGQSNPALQILIESLDIKIIATNLEDKKIKESLQHAGIKYFQGSLLAEPKLV